MTKEQFDRIASTLDRILTLLEAVVNLRDIEGVKYGSVEVEVRGTVQVEGSVTSYDPR